MGHINFSSPEVCLEDGAQDALDTALDPNVHHQSLVEQPQLNTNPLIIIIIQNVNHYHSQFASSMFPLLMFDLTKTKKITQN